MNRLIQRNWKRLAPASIVLIAAVTVLSRRGETEQITDIIDEGGAPAAVVLRFKGKPGDTGRLVGRATVSSPMLGKTSTFFVRGGGRTIAVVGDHVESEVTIDKVTAEQDDLKILTTLKAMMETRIAVTYDRRGNLLKSSSETPLPSYNFPHNAVRAGESWTGFLKGKAKKEPVSFTLERILKYHGHVIALVRRNYADAEEHSTREWLDVSAGAFIKSLDYENVKVPTGGTLLSTTEVQTIAAN